MAKLEKSQVKTQVICPDCKCEYTAGAPHGMFCSARTCRNCGTTFSYTIPVYDSRPEALDEDGLPERRCDKCLEDSPNAK